MGRRYGDFDPWSQAERAVAEGRIRLDVAGPPCPGCKHWVPVAVPGRWGSYDGVRLCHADEQYRDFSCYEPKGGNG